MRFFHAVRTARSLRNREIYMTVIIARVPQKSEEVPQNDYSRQFQILEKLSGCDCCGSARPWRFLVERKYSGFRAASFGSFSSLCCVTPLCGSHNQSSPECRTPDFNPDDKATCHIRVNL